MEEQTPTVSSDDSSVPQLNSQLNKKLIELLTSDTSANCDRWVVAKAGAVTIGAITGIPSVRIARKLAGNSAALSVIYPYSMLASIASLSIWSLLDFIYFQQIRLRPSSNIFSSTNLARPLAVVGMAILTTFPYVIISYQYNNGEIIYPVITFICDVALNISPFNRNLRLLINNLSTHTSQQMALEAIRSLYIKRLNKGIDVLISLPPQDRQILLDKFAILHAGQSGQVDKRALELIASVMMLGKNVNSAQLNSSAFMQKCIRYSLVSASFILPAAWAVIITKVVYQAVIDKVINPFFGIAIALATSVPAYLLEGILSRLLNFKCYQAIQDLRQGNYYKNYSQQYYLLGYLLLSGLALFTVAFSFASRTQVARDEIEGNLIYLLLPIIIFSTVFYKASAMLSLIPELIETYARKFSVDQLRELAILLQKLREFSAIFGDVSLEEFAAFYHESKEVINQHYQDDEILNADEEYQHAQSEGFEVVRPNLLEKSIGRIKDACQCSYSFWSKNRAKEHQSDIELHEPLSPETDAEPVLLKR